MASDDKRTRLKQWLQSGEAILQPATFTQRELWETAPVPPEDVSNHICAVITIQGPVSRELCQKAMVRVVARQEVLRLSMLPGKNGPVQLIRRERAPALWSEELIVPPQEDAVAALDRRIADLIAAPLDLVRGPLYRLHVLRQSAERHCMVLVIHHAIADGWTLGVFMGDLMNAYAQGLLGVPAPLPRVPQSYTEWGAAERAFWAPERIRTRGDYWKHQLANTPRVWDAPEPAPAEPGRRCRQTAALTPELVSALRAVSHRQGVTLFSTLLAAFQIVLAAASGRSRILVGSPVAGRPRKASHETMGSYAGIVPLAGDVPKDAPAGSLLEAAHETSIDGFAHALPFVELVRYLGEPVLPGRNPVFDTRFALQNHPTPDVSMPGLEVSYRTRSTGTARFDLACELTEIPSEMEVVWLFREDMFSPLDVTRMHRHFTATLHALTENLATPAGVLMKLRE